MRDGLLGFQIKNIGLFVSEQQCRRGRVISELATLCLFGECAVHLGTRSYQINGANIIWQSVFVVYFMLVFKNKDLEVIKHDDKMWGERK